MSRGSGSSELRYRIGGVISRWPVFNNRWTRASSSAVIRIRRGGRVKRVVARRLDSGRFTKLDRIGIDEFSYRKRHPALRGTGVRNRRLRRVGRFIPARAGNGRRPPRPLGSLSVHPRACGERPPEDSAGVKPPGSSPRVRGTAVRSHPPEIFPRFIPARAGNGELTGSPHRSDPVHPRACGERRPRQNARLCECGSSPRVRGTVRIRTPDYVEWRFIPARAGNGCSETLPNSTTTVHPRACGERSAWYATDAARDGSSPRVRGTALPYLGDGPRYRFIPARAGNGEKQRTWRMRRPVHPRACGERSSSPAPAVGGIGSSPRVRGTARKSLQFRLPTRFIPARAGNGMSPLWLPRLRSVHPRACGERMKSPEIDRLWNGSSPRVRGTAVRSHPPEIFCRFIPARAGNGTR